MSDCDTCHGTGKILLSSGSIAHNGPTLIDHPCPECNDGAYLQFLMDRGWHHTRPIRETWDACSAYKDKRIAELEGGLQEIIDHAYENGSHARTMRKIAIGTIRGRRG